MNSSAFVSAAPVLARSTSSLSSNFVSRRSASAVVPRRCANVVMMADNKEKIPQGFTAFSEQLNGRAAMMGFILALATEALTGKGIIGQVSSIFDVVNLASALGN